MGVDNPRGSVSGLPDFAARPSLSGGEQSALGNSTVVRQPMDLSGMTRALDQAAGTIINNLKQQREQQQEADRAVEYAKLTSQTQVEAIQSYNLYQSSYAGNPDEFAAGYLQTYDKYANGIQQGITDQKLRNQYAIFSANQRAKVQLQALEGQNQLYVKDFQTKYTGAKTQLDDLIKAAPTKDTLASVNDSLDIMYQPIKDRLKLAGADAAAEKDLVADKERFAKTMILRQAMMDPDQALQTLADPEVNKYIQDPGDQLEIENKIMTIRNTRNAPFEAEAKESVRNYMAGLATGKDVSGLQKRIGELAQMGVVDPSAFQQLQVAQEMAGSFADLRNGMIALSPDQFEEQLSALNPDNNSDPADNLLDDRRAFYSTAAAALRQQYKFNQDHPTSSTAALTGATDPETAALQYIHARMRAGENLNNINFLDKTKAQELQNRINNAITTGSVDELTNLYNEIRTTYGADEKHSYRQVANGVDMADMVFNQLGRGSDNQNPIGKKMVAVYHLLPKGEAIGKHNNLLIAAALMKPDQRKSYLTAAGIESTAALEKELGSNPVWKEYFKADPLLSDKARQLQFDQKSVLLDAALLNIGVGGYKATGGLFGTPLFETSAKQNALDALIKDYLPYTPATISRPSLFKTKNPQDVFNTFANRTADAGGIGSGNATSSWRKDFNFEPSTVLIPKEYEGVVDEAAVANTVAKTLSNDNFILQTFRLPGINDNAPGGPVATANMAEKIYDAVIGPVEGGYVANDAGMGPTNLGINFTNNQGILKKFGITDPSQMRNLTKEQAKQITYEKYYRNTPAAQVKDPKLAALLLDISFNGGLKNVLAKVPELESVKNLQPTPANIKRLDEVYNKVREARFGFWKGAKGGSQWKEFGNAWTNRQATVDKKAEALRKVVPPLTIDSLKPGQKMLFQGIAKKLRGNLKLESTPDLNGVRVHTLVDGRWQPVNRPDGRFLEYSFDFISKNIPKD